jgi:hypothetical protein
MIADSAVDEQHARHVGEQEEQHERGDDVHCHLLFIPRFTVGDSARSAWVG